MNDSKVGKSLVGGNHHFVPSFVLDSDAVSLLFSRPMQDLHIWWTSRQAQNLQNKARPLFCCDSDGPRCLPKAKDHRIPCLQVDALRWELEQKEKQSKRMSGSAFVTFKEKWGLSGLAMEHAENSVLAGCSTFCEIVTFSGSGRHTASTSLERPLFPHVLRIANLKRFYCKIFPVVGSPSAEIRPGRLLWFCCLI